MTVIHVSFPAPSSIIPRGISFPDFGIAPEAKNHCKFITVQFCFQE